jgi:putative transposase
MKNSRFTQSQVVAILKEGEPGLLVAQLTRKHGNRAGTYYRWKSKYAAPGWRR